MSTSDPTASPTTFDLEHRVDSVDATLQNPRTAVVALGSNLGNRLETLQGAVDALADTPGLKITGVSAVFETAALGGPDEQPNYYNAVVLLRTTLPPYSLLERANAIEDAFGRERAVRWGARTLDVDILSYEKVLSTDPVLLLPHPRAHERAFVLAPWTDVDPAGELPGHGKVAELLAGLGGEGAQGVRRRTDIQLRLPE
ncbi:2-amino-4-hydroxy-6-hydroxymethyldihydropteridine diphosphokinase [Kitasatospora sp. GAS204B]|uniref:2-amino-4-hydroxy-6- hydroxymethyldihydropteridine diphosphokinase n=1 Tax=unclassified Kitasatospora TaxID=2633591 RepID=UPI0024738C50|nr:2-amino-4-hydroxy-6-hydroxymethyldihydropteridine diphosphokinase [Kitasatospora sp. GAS204B]MDH6118216.1 2-amino-4-hydroxy-6-hydroxymethyldihydropteridine diphosphokinase [Kitasatospora sp. GAS204B]